MNLLFGVGAAPHQSVSQTASPQGEAMKEAKIKPSPWGEGAERKRGE